MKEPKKDKQQEIGQGFFRKHRGLRRMFWIVAIGGAVFIFVKVPFIIVVRGNNGHALTASYNFSEDDFSHPRLKLLRRQERLDQVVAPGRTQFEKIVLLRKWVSRQWKTQTPFYYPAWDAVEILDLARRNNRGFCAQYAIVFLQACQSMGIHARYVDLDSHFATQVWSDDFNRWIFMDPTNDVHYEKNGAPLSMRDLCRAYWKGEDGIFKVGSDGTRTEMKRDDLKGLSMYAILPYADQLAHPISLIVNGTRRVLVREPDYHRYPLIGRDSVGFSIPELGWKEPYAKEWLPGRFLSDDPQDFRYPFNQAFVFLAGLVIFVGWILMPFLIILGFLYFFSFLSF